MKQLLLISTSMVLMVRAVAFQAFATDVSPISLTDLAGSYYFGDGTGVNCTLSLTKQGTFVFEWRGCLGVYGKNNGNASIAEGVLHLAPKSPMREGFGGTPTDFFALRWGTRMYLIPTNDIIAFCSDINQGSEPRHGNWGEYYLRQNDWDKAVTGFPAVPNPWTSYLLSKPVSGKITELVGKQEAWLDLGTQHGILQGMILTARDYGKLMFSQVRVEMVETNRCRIKCQWQDSALAVGQTVSTHFHE